jgi:hypothetical protein
MPTTDLLFSLGYTIVIYIVISFVLSDSAIIGFLYVLGGYNFLYVITFYNIKITTTATATTTFYPVGGMTLCFLICWLAVPCGNHDKMWTVLIYFSFCKFLMLFSIAPVTVILVFNCYKFPVLFFFFFIPIRVMWYLIISDFVCV